MITNEDTNSPQQSGNQCADMLAVVVCDRNAHTRRIDADLLCTLLSPQVRDHSVPTNVGMVTNAAGRAILRGMVPLQRWTLNTYEVSRR